MGKADAAAEFSMLKAHRAQELMAKRIILEDKLPLKIKLVAGVDAAYANDFAVGAVAVLDYESLELLEVQTAVVQTKFPYVPTLFAFREIPVAVACIQKLQLQPDVFLVDGHGRAHPYRCGFASHLGLALGKPTVGVAKNRLVGEPKQIGEKTFLTENEEVIGELLSIGGSKPVYVSIGHRVSLETAVKIVKHCMRETRIPEPIRIAHQVAQEKRKAQLPRQPIVNGRRLC